MILSIQFYKMAREGYPGLEISAPGERVRKKTRGIRFLYTDNHGSLLQQNLWSNSRFEIYASKLSIDPGRKLAIENNANYTHT